MSDFQHSYVYFILMWLYFFSFLLSIISVLLHFVSNFTFLKNFDQFEALLEDDL